MWYDMVWYDAVEQVIISMQPAEEDQRVVLNVNTAHLKNRRM